MSNTEKTCPACAESIKIDAIVCRYCGNRFDPEQVVRESEMRADVQRKNELEDEMPNSEYIDFLIAMAVATELGDTFVTENFTQFDKSQWDKIIKKLEGMKFYSDMTNTVRSIFEDDKVILTDELILDRVSAIGMIFVPQTVEEIYQRQKDKKNVADRTVVSKSSSDTRNLGAQKSSISSGIRLASKSNWWTIIIVVGTSLVLATCIGYFGSEDRLSPQERTVKRVCEAAGGCR